MIEREQLFKDSMDKLYEHMNFCMGYMQFIYDEYPDLFQKALDNMNRDIGYVTWRIKRDNERRKIWKEKNSRQGIIG